MRDHEGNQQTAPPAAQAQPRRRMSISTRLRWSYLISSTLPLLLVGALLIVTLFQVQQRNAYATQLAFGERIAGNIATFIFDLEQQLLRSARDLRPEEPGGLLDATTGTVVASFPDLRALIVVDRAGLTVAQERSDVLRESGYEPQPVDEGLLRDAISTGRGGRTTISLAQDGQAVFQLVLPIRSRQTGEITGALSAEVSAARLDQILRLDARGSHAYLTDVRGQLLLGSAERLPDPERLALIFGQNQVAEYLDWRGELVVAARAPINPLSSASWSVVVEQPSSAFFVDVYRSLFLLTALVTLVGLLALGWALFQSRAIVRPIAALSTGTRELAGGHLDHRIRVAGGDELGQLAYTFNQMAARLQESLHAIEQQNEHLRRGLVLARDIQQGLLPNSPPWRTEMLSVHGRSLPASEVGGDFYTYIALPDGRAAVAIGDISGKGVAAALLMALTSSTLELQAQSLDRPAALLSAMHEALRPRLLANQMNAALLIAVFEANASSVRIANAGMIAPLLVRAPGGLGPRSEFLDVGGLPIGTRLSFPYAEVSVPLQPGDTLIFLSDGIVEAHNSAGELYGFDRLEALVADLPPDYGVSELVQAILDGVLGFVGVADPHDDITIIAIRPAIGSPEPSGAALPAALAELRG